jgi:hypothetical protein
MADPGPGSLSLALSLSRPIVMVVEELVSLLLAQPQTCLLVASSGLCAQALLRLRLWGRARELAASIEGQPACSLAEAVHELWRRRAAGEPAKLVGVFEGFVTCSTPLLLEPAPSAPRGQPTQCVMQSIQISKESSSLWGWNRMDSVPLVDHHCVVPFELCDAPQVGAQQGCAHVLSSGAAFDVDAASGSTQQFTIMRQDPHALLRRVYRVLRVGSHVAIHGELSLEPWMGRADLRAVLRSPTAGLPFFCVHHGGKVAMSKAVLQEANVHLRAAQLLLALAAAACAWSWWIWSSRRDRAALHQSMIDDARRGVAPEAQERYAPSASPTLRPCCICNTRPRDCVLLDCRHQVCCLACASTLAHRAADPESLAAQVPPAAGLLPDGDAGEGDGARGDGALQALKTQAERRGLKLRWEDELVSEQEWRARIVLTTSAGNDMELPWSGACLGLKRAKQAAAELALDCMPPIAGVYHLRPPEPVANLAEESCLIGGKEVSHAAPCVRPASARC